MNYKKLRNTGFTLIELMVVVAILGIIAGLAIPPYLDSMKRSRVADGLFLASEAKLTVQTSSKTTTMLEDAADEWNARSGGTGNSSKYVESVLIDRATGEVTVTINPVNTGLDISAGAPITVVYTPYLRTGLGLTRLDLALAANTTVGSFDWGCSSEANLISTNAGKPAITQGTLPANLAPSDCR